MRRIYDCQYNKFVLSWFFTKTIDFLKSNGKFKCHIIGHKDVKIFNKVLKLTLLWAIFMDDLGWSIWDDQFDLDFKIFLLVVVYLNSEEWEIELTTPKGPYQTTHLDYLELNYITQKSGAKIVYFKNIKQETGWTIYYGAIHSVTLVAAKDKWVIISSPIHLILEFSNSIQNQFDLFLHFHRFHQQLDPHMGQELNQRDMNQLDDPQTSFHQYVLV